MPSIHDLPRRVHRPLGAGLYEETGERFYEIEGVRYPTAEAACIALGLPRDVVYRRCQSDKYPEWIQHGRREGGKKDPAEAAAEAAEARAARKDLIEPAGWALDGGAKRKPILDPNFTPPKVVGYAGWQKCLKCWSWCFSGDVTRQRKCYECGGEASPRVALDSALDALHTRVLKAIARLQKDVDTRKSEIANRWKTVGIDPADKARFAQNETLAAVRQIKDNAEAELDRYLKEAGAPHEALVAQRPFYSSPVQVLNRVTLGDPKRTAFLEQLQFAGPVELGHLAQVAVSSQDAPLAAAVVSLLDKMPGKERPVGPAEVANAMKLDEYLKVQEYMKLGDARLQGVIVAIRTWKAGKSNPINTLTLALKERDINHDLLGGGDDD